MAETLGTALEDLIQTLAARAAADPQTSYTAQLLAKGPAKCAEKFGEEAVEAVIAASQGDSQALTHEAADVLYHLLVMLKACDVEPQEVAAELARRRDQSGLEEKASRT